MSAFNPNEFSERLVDQAAREERDTEKQPREKKGPAKLEIQGSVTNNGAGVNFKRNSLLRDGDATTLSVKGNDHETNYNASYSMPVFFKRSLVPNFLLSDGQDPYARMRPQFPASVTFQADLETQTTKHQSREKSFIVSLASMESPWRVKLLRTYRQNTIDAFSSREFLRHDALPSIKHAIGLDYEIFSQSQLTRLSAEMALPMTDQTRQASHVKCEVRHQQRWSLVPDKINAVCDLQAGKIFPLGSGQQPTYVNDRFFLYHTGGYMSVGHAEPSLRPQSSSAATEEAKKTEQDNLRQGLHRVVLGDDMGCDQFAYLGGRLDFLNIPLLTDYGVRLYSQAEMIYYPPHGTPMADRDLWSNLRGSLGFGISIPLNQMINFGLYYNAVNFNSRVGDIERASLVNFTFNFF